MNIYDTANKLAAELKQTDEYKAYKNSNELSVKLQNLYTELYQNEIAKNYLEAEMRFSVMVTDINKIISEAIKDVIG